MKQINPSQSNFNRRGGALRNAQSVYKVLTAGVALAQPTGTDATGVYNSFEQDNGNGVMLRVGGSASSEPLKWAGSNVTLVINHGLQRQPIGFWVCDKDKTCDVYRTAVPNSDTISLACTDGTANTTIYIF